MEKMKELKLEELDNVNGGIGEANPGGNGAGYTSATASTENNGGSDTTLPGISFKKNN